MFRLCDMLKKNTQACEECEKISEVISNMFNDTWFVTFSCSIFEKKVRPCISAFINLVYWRFYFIISGHNIPKPGPSSLRGPFISRYTSSARDIHMT